MDATDASLHVFITTGTGRCYHRITSVSDGSWERRVVHTACGLDSRSINYYTFPLSKILSSGIQFRPCKVCYAMARAPRRPA